MSYMVNIDDNELSAYISTIIKGIDKGLENSEYTISVNEKILLELSIINSKKTGSGLKIYIADASKKTDKEELSKITIPISKKKYFI